MQSQKGKGSNARATAGAPQLPTTAVLCRKNPSFRSVPPFPHPLRFKAPLPRKELETRRRPQQRQKERTEREIERLREMKKQKKPETLSNSRDKRTVGFQTKWLAEVARKGLSRWPLEMAGQTEPAAGAGGPQGAGEVLPPPPARCPGRSAPHFTPRRPRPRLCGAGNTPRRPARTCSFLAAPSLPRGRPLSPSRSPGPEPTTGRGWMGRP